MQNSSKDHDIKFEFHQKFPVQGADFNEELWQKNKNYNGEKKLWIS